MSPWSPPGAPRRSRLPNAPRRSRPPLARPLPPPPRPPRNHREKRAHARPDAAREFLRQLQAEGLSPNLLYSVAQALVVAEQAEKRRAIQSGPNRRVWESSRPKDALTAEDRNKLLELDLQQEDRLAALLGPGFRREMSIERYSKDPQFAGIPLEKLVRLDELSRERSVIAMDEARAGRSPDAMMLRMGQARERQAQVEKERAEVLTPEELALFNRYHSNNAVNLMRQLSGFDLSDAQYVTVYESIAHTDGDQPFARASQFGLVADSLLRTGNPDMAISYLTREDRQSGAAAKIFQDAGLTAAESISRYQVLVDSQRLVGDEAETA